MPMTIAVLTMAKGRHDHLLSQVDGLSVGSVPPDLHVVVSMGDRDLTRGRLPLTTDRWRTVVRPVQTDRRALPLAAARNLAAELAVVEGADLLVFLSGDVAPGSRTLERYAEAVESRAEHGLDGLAVWAGPLLHLPPVEDEVVGYPAGRLAELARPADGSSALEPGQLLVEDWDHFTGEAFAMTADDFEHSGGFCADYAGHGLEDADFAAQVRDAGAVFVRVGGATAYRQPVPAPAPEDEIRIARRHVAVWRERWGTEPQHPLLDRLADPLSP